ncbi:MAG: type III pantothenate kinase [Chitinophagales bacterium]|nr:type III pantothenate kinase [Chitinophagales bacterium]
MYLICLDIGNTRMKIGVFHEGNALEVLVSAKGDLQVLKNLVKKYPNHRFVVSSTAKLESSVKDFLYLQPNFLEISHQARIPFKNLYTTPQTLGRDRIALAAAAVDLFPHQNCLIIDTGTCITLDFVNHQGEYLGGSIHPGISMRLKALHNYTDKLPLVEKSWQESNIGNSTETCIQIGVIRASVMEINAFVEEYNKKYDNLKVILTGGDMDLFLNKIKNEIFAHPNLVLEGLQKIARYNVQ